MHVRISFYHGYGKNLYFHKFPHPFFENEWCCLIIILGLAWYVNIRRGPIQIKRFNLKPEVRAVIDGRQAENTD